MSDRFGLSGTRGTPPGSGVPIPDHAHDAMVSAAREVMAIQDITRGDRANPIRVRGTLTLPAEDALSTLRPQFEAVGYTPVLRHEDDTDVIRALPMVFERGQDSARVNRIAAMLLVATLITVFLTGVGQHDGLYHGPLQVMIARLTGDTSSVLYPQLLPDDATWLAALWTGVQYTLALLGILGAHEMGHYLVARYHKVHTTPPFFIPLPPGISILGTMGAVIAMREPSPNRRIQFDIGIAGPLAGLIVAIPVMFIGLSMSHVSTVQEALGDMPDVLLQDGRMSFLHEGNSLLYLAIKYLVFGQVLPQGDVDVWIHPVAFAAWAGFLVTSLNLIPVGQLDGGHIVYGLLGNKASKLRIPVLIVLAIMALLGTVRELGAMPNMLPDALRDLTQTLPGWSGWWLWVAIIYFMLRSHAPVLDEITGLDDKRKALGIAMLVIFVLIFTPAPLIIEEAAVASAGWLHQIVGLW